MINKCIKEKKKSTKEKKKYNSTLKNKYSTMFSLDLNTAQCIIVIF